MTSAADRGGCSGEAAGAWREVNTLVMTSAQMDGMYAVLCQADADRDAEALAVAAWRLYGEAGAARAETCETRAALAQLAAAARAAVASARLGALDPLAHLRHVLGARGWMPLPGTPVSQLLAGHLDPGA